MPHILIVNACDIVPDERVAQMVPLVQQFDREVFAPALSLDEATYDFVPRGQIPTPTTDVWPIFINNHSTDPGALGWHDDAADLIFSRVFAGDCQKYGIDWMVDCTHEAWEMRGDPAINKTVHLPDGDLAAYELCDPVEDDLYAIPFNGIRVSDFVLPAYWQAAAPGARYDYGGHLGGPCPTLASGGYQSLYRDGQWTQVTARKLDGTFSYRSQRRGRVYKRSTLRR